jgi:hypothetical protein
LELAGDDEDEGAAEVKSIILTSGAENSPETKAEDSGVFTQAIN